MEQPHRLHVPRLNKFEEKEAEDLTPPSAKVMHESVRKEGEDELNRTSSGLAWSGWAAGLSMGFSLISEASLRAMLPAEDWARPIEKLGFPAGFLIVTLGRQQLFTENTITPIIPLLARRDRETLFNVIRLWVVILLSNLVGALTVAWALTRDIFSPTVQHSFLEIAQMALRVGFWGTFLKSIFAGWLIALMIWILAGMKERGAHVIFALTYIMGIAGFNHIITGSVDVLYLVLTQNAGLADYLRFSIPTLLGNVLGGVALVSIANHAQVVAGGGVRE